MTSYFEVEGDNNDYEQVIRIKGFGASGEVLATDPEAMNNVGHMLYNNEGFILLEDADGDTVLLNVRYIENIKLVVEEDRHLTPVPKNFIRGGRERF